MKPENPWTLAVLALFIAVFSQAHAQAPKPAPPADPKPSAAAPDIPPDKRIEILTLSNQKHVLQEQIYQVQIQFLQAQSQAQGNVTNIQSSLSQVQKQLDTATDTIDYDKQKFSIDQDTATFREKPTPGNVGASPAVPAKKP